MAEKQFTYSDVSEHNTKKDLYIVVHDKVYNASSFVDEHPYASPIPYKPNNPHTFWRILFQHTPPSPGYGIIASMGEDEG